MKYLKYVLLVFYIGLIAFCFYSSLQNGKASSDLSSGVTQKILTFLDNLYPNININYNDAHTIIRKLIGHYGYHVIVGITGCTTYLLFNINNTKNMLYSFIVSISASIVSELLQLFASDRACDIKDMIINFFGFFTGILIYEVVYTLRKNKIKIKKQFKY